MEHLIDLIVDWFKVVRKRKKSIDEILDNDEELFRQYLRRVIKDWFFGVK